MNSHRSATETIERWLIQGAETAPDLLLDRVATGVRRVPQERRPYVRSVTAFVGALGAAAVVAAVALGGLALPGTREPLLDAPMASASLHAEAARNPCALISLDEAGAAFGVAVGRAEEYVEAFRARGCRFYTAADPETVVPVNVRTREAGGQSAEERADKMRTSGETVTRLPTRFPAYLWNWSEDGNEADYAWTVIGDVEVWVDFHPANPDQPQIAQQQRVASELLTAIVLRAAGSSREDG